MTTTLALWLLASAITAVQTTSSTRCTTAQVAAMTAEVTRHPDYTAPGILGLVRCTCNPSTCARPPLAGSTHTPRTAR